MPASHVQVQPDGTGKDIDADSVTSTESGTPTVYRQDVVIADPAAYANKSTVFVGGELHVQDEPHATFIETFDVTTLDTVNRWITPATGGTGVAATNGQGGTTLSSGTTLNSYSLLQSQASFPPVAPGWVWVEHAVGIETPILTTGYRFWGAGITTGTPTIAAPLTDAYGFEVATSGKMYAVTYQGGVRNVVGDLSAATGNSTQPADGFTHAYHVFWRGDKAWWAIDSPQNTVAAMPNGAGAPNTNTLPLKFLAISNAGTAVTINVSAATAADTSKSAFKISDGTYPWRQATVGAGGALSTVASINRTQMAWGTVSAGLGAGTTATDAMIVLGQQFRAGSSAGTTGTSFAITAGKTFRVTSMTAGLLANAALVSSAVFTLRYNPAGAAVTGSAPSLVATLGVPAVAGQLVTANVPVPDGLDLPGGTTPGQFGISVNPTWATTAPQVYAWISGYEW